MWRLDVGGNHSADADEHADDPADPAAHGGTGLHAHTMPVADDSNTA